MTTKRNRFRLFINRALSQSLLRQVFILICFLIVLLGVSYLLLLGSEDDWITFCKDNHHKMCFWLLPIYLLIDTNALNAIYLGGAGGWMLIACSIIYVLGLIVCSGMLIGVITNYIGKRVEDHRDGLIHYLKSGHYIIMGYDEMVPSIIQEIFAKDKEAFILLLTAYDAKKIKERLKKSVAKQQYDQIIVNYGQRIAKEYYDEIHLESSAEIFVVGNRTLSAHDAVNVECIDNICSYLQEHTNEQLPKRITCVFEDLDTYSAFKTTEIFKKIRDLDIEFIPYNFYAGWARQVFVRRSYREKNLTEKLPYPSVYGDGISDEDNKYVHLVFVGTSNFSVSFAMEAAHLLHFPNFEKDHLLKTRITFIEKNADEEMRLFTTRNRHFFEIQPYYYRDLTKGYSPDEVSLQKRDLLSNELEHLDFLDVDFEFIKGDVYSSDVQHLIRDWAKCHKEDRYLSIFLAMADQRNNFNMGMNMPDEVYDNAVPVFIRQDRADDFVTNLRSTDDKEIPYYYILDNQLQQKARKMRYANIYPFGMDDMAYFSDELALSQAKLVNYLYCNSDNNHFPDRLALNAISDDTIWKEANKAWRQLKVADKWSNIYAAYSIRCKLDSLRAMRKLNKDDHGLDQTALTATEIETIAKVEHNRWNVEKLLMGYRKAKPYEDKYNYPSYANQWKSNKKHYYIHYDIRPYANLGPVKQMDSEIAEYIPWIISMAERKSDKHE